MCYLFWLLGIYTKCENVKLNDVIFVWAHISHIICDRKLRRVESTWRISKLFWNFAIFFYFLLDDFIILIIKIQNFHKSTPFPLIHSFHRYENLSNNIFYKKKFCVCRKCRFEMDIKTTREKIFDKENFLDEFLMIIRN